MVQDLSQVARLTDPQGGPAGSVTALREVQVRGPAFEDLFPGQELPRGGALVHLRSRVQASDPETGAENQVLDWRFVAVCSAADTEADILHPVKSLAVQGWSGFDERGQR
jgi:hypothetical protein